MVKMSNLYVILHFKIKSARTANAPVECPCNDWDEINTVYHKEAIYSN